MIVKNASDFQNDGDQSIVIKSFDLDGNNYAIGLSIDRFFQEKKRYKKIGNKFIIGNILRRHQYFETYQKHMKNKSVVSRNSTRYIIGNRI